MCTIGIVMLLCSVLFQLTDCNIGNSRDTSFEQLILTETNGRGVDLVLNSLSGERLQASVRCLAPRGRFLEIGKADLVSNVHLGMSYYVSFLTSYLLVLFSLFSDWFYWQEMPVVYRLIKASRAKLHYLGVGDLKGPRTMEVTNGI
jgi:NADPH:quinone reductase-like Zn-dependent oxidoreductase